MTLELYDPHLEIQLTDYSLGNVSCTCAMGASADDRNSFGRRELTMKKVRVATGDRVGGTTVQQVDDAIAKLTTLDNLSTGYWKPARVFEAIKLEGKGFLVAMVYGPVQAYGARQLKQGVTQPGLVSGQEKGFTGWHAELWHDVIPAGGTRVILGKTLAAPPGEAALVVYDPLCDGRRPTVASGPVAYPWTLVRAIIEASTGDYGGRLYGALTLDGRVEVDDPNPPKPKRTLKFGGRPINQQLRTSKPANLRSRPRRNPEDPKRYRVKWVPANTPFHAYQVTDEGTNINGSRKWFGNRGGDLWVHESRVRGA